MKKKLKSHENKENKDAKLVNAPVTSQKLEASSSSDNLKNRPWEDDEIKLLVKGVQIIPVGTRDRFSNNIILCLKRIVLDVNLN